MKESLHNWKSHADEDLEGAKEKKKRNTEDGSGDGIHIVEALKKPDGINLNQLELTWINMKKTNKLDWERLQKKKSSADLNGWNASAKRAWDLNLKRETNRQIVQFFKLWTSNSLEMPLL